jgi:hypothetical protein
MLPIFGIAVIFAQNYTFLNKEEINGVKHIQLMQFGQNIFWNCALSPGVP